MRAERAALGRWGAGGFVGSTSGHQEKVERANVGWVTEHSRASVDPFAESEMKSDRTYASPGKG